MLTIQSPYTGDGEWLRGNVHTHTTISDGEYSPEEVLTAYENRSYDYLAISDHDVLVDSDTYCEDNDLIRIPAVEVTANGPHVVHIGATDTVEPTADRQVVLDAITDQRAIGVAAHPNWERNFAHFSHNELERLKGYVGLEIYNGNIERAAGSPLATDRWDRLLSAGRTVWGFGTDDTHAPVDVANAWTVVQAAKRTPTAVLEALRTGQSYVSTGITIESIAVDGLSITVETSDADRIQLVSDHGRLQATVDDSSATFEVPRDLSFGTDHTYVRIECRGRGSHMAWTQPFMLE